MEPAVRLGGRGVRFPPTLARDGFAVTESGLSVGELNALRDAVTPVLAQHQERGGVRRVAAKMPSVIPTITGPLKALARSHFDSEPFAVRILLFDKTPRANWKVSWHQDVTIAVTEHREAARWGPWSRKDGVWHVRPPAPVLASMLTVRLHLDSCGAANGPVRVIPGSHRLGRLSDVAVAAALLHAEPHDCEVPAGGILLMRPLILHSSAPATTPTHRRVLHVEFASDALPDGMMWAERDGRSLVPGAA